MDESAPLETLRRLEISLHEPQVRCSAEKFEALLHPAFREFGRSGASYSRDETIASVASERRQPLIWSQGFELELFSENLALLTYRSAHVNERGELERHTNRSSLWQKTADGWKIRFHQGTPTFAFEKHTS